MIFIFIAFQTSTAAPSCSTALSSPFMVHTTFPPPTRKKTGDGVDGGSESSQLHVLVFFNAVFSVLFFSHRGHSWHSALWSQLQAAAHSLFPESRLSPVGSAAYLCIWNHSNRVAFKRCHFTFCLLSRGILHNLSPSAGVSMLPPAVSIHNWTWKRREEEV